MVAGNTLVLYRGGKALFENLLSSLNEAAYHIYFHMYIFSDDVTGKAVGDALLAAAQRGVKIFLVLDAFGSKELSEKTIRKWKDAGISVRLFSPLFGYKGIRIRRRLHQKIICIDGRIGFTGGVNISDRYSGWDGSIPWLDHMVRIDGPAVLDLEKVCRIYGGRKMRKESLAISPSMGHGTAEVTVLRNDRMRGKREVALSYREAIGKAQSTVIIFASYFLPGSSLRKSLHKATARNIRVILVLPGMSDVGIVSSAMHFLYPWLFKNRMEIYEWNRSIHHAKLMMIDEEWMSVGSYNLNHLSDFSSIELNIAIKDPRFVSQCTATCLELIEKECKKIMPEEFKKTSGTFNKWKNRLAYDTVRFLFRLLYFLTSKE